MPINDRARDFFLLHFWSYVAQIYQPIHVDAKEKVTLHGYAIAIPDVRNLSSCCQHFPSILQQRSTEIKWDKPDEAIVSDPIEAGLMMLSSIQTYLQANTDGIDINNLLFGVDVFHLFRKKHEAQILSIQHYLPDKDIRQMLILEGLPSNRSRINDGGAPKVEFKDFPDPDRYADDFLFGFCVTDRAAIAAHPDRPSRRDSVFRNNMAVALSSDINTHLQQAPRNTEDSPWNIKETSLLYRQVVYTAYQYPFALALSDCLPQPEWTSALIRAIGQLNRVAGGDSVSHFQMGPRSIIIRLTPFLVAGYDNYGFQEDGTFKELNRLVNGELPGQELWLGGEIVRKMPEDIKQKLADRQVHLIDSPQKLLAEVSQQFLGGA